MQPYAVVEGVEGSVSLQNDVYAYIKPNDTLFKRKGSLKYYWIHTGDTTIYYQEYAGV